MNLCNSGIAACYTGRSVAEAAAVLRAERPDAVTLNEICRDDLPVLQAALAGAEPGRHVRTAFEAATEPRTARPVRCRNGQPFGIGLLTGVRRPDRGVTRTAARLPMQDPDDLEQRVWLCLHAIDHFFACTAHLSSTSAAVAIRQCRYLTETVIPRVRGPHPEDPLILGADLNLTDHDSPNVQSCLPAGIVRTDDGGRQHVLASDSLVVTATRSIDMHRTTDHPGLLADLSVSRRGQSGCR